MFKKNFSKNQRNLFNTFCWKTRLISNINRTFITDKNNDINLSAKVEHIFKGSRNIDDRIYSPGKVVILLSH